MTKPTHPDGPPGPCIDCGNRTVEGKWGKRGWMPLCYACASRQNRIYARHYQTREDTPDDDILPNAFEDAARAIEDGT